jgi:hypothetical protein
MVQLSSHQPLPSHSEGISECSKIQHAQSIELDRSRHLRLGYLHRPSDALLVPVQMKPRRILSMARHNHGGASTVIDTWIGMVANVILVNVVWPALDISLAFHVCDTASVIVAAIVPLQYPHHVSTIFMQYKHWMSLKFKFKHLLFIFHIKSSLTCIVTSKFCIQLWTRKFIFLKVKAS